MSEERQSGLKPCGTTDPQAVLPPPVHYDCSDCKRLIVALLHARYPQPKSAPPVVTEQALLFDDVKPRKLRA